MTRPIGVPTYRGHAMHPHTQGQTARETVASQPERAQTAPQAPCPSPTAAGLHQRFWMS